MAGYQTQARSLPVTRYKSRRQPVRAARCGSRSSASRSDAIAVERRVSRVLKGNDDNAGCTCGLLHYPGRRHPGYVPAPFVRNYSLRGQLISARRCWSTARSGEPLNFCTSFVRRTAPRKLPFTDMPTTSLVICVTKSRQRSLAAAAVSSKPTSAGPKSQDPLNSGTD